MRVYPDGGPYEAAIDNLVKVFRGTFPTGVLCVCGTDINDHATSHNPNTPPQDPRHMPMGPGPHPRERFAEVAAKPAFHEYWCDKCGLVYKTEVIEGVRGYVPREKRPEFAEFLRTPQFSYGSLFGTPDEPEEDRTRIMQRPGGRKPPKEIDPRRK